MPNRREFIKSTTLAASVTALAATTQSQAKPTVKKKTEFFRQKLLEGLGGPWPEGGDLKPKKLKTEQKDGYRLEWITYELEPSDRCPAILLVPDGVSDKSTADSRAIPCTTLARRWPSSATWCSAPIHFASRNGRIRKRNCAADRTSVLNSYATRSPANAWRGKTSWTCGAPSITSSRAKR